MDYLDFIACIFVEDSIGLKRVNSYKLIVGSKQSLEVGQGSDFHVAGDKSKKKRKSFVILCICTVV